jgi:hypothetical protein
MQITTRALEDNAVNGAKFRLLNNEELKALNNAGNSSISLFKVNASDEWILLVTPKIGSSNVATEDFVNTGLALKINSTLIGAANGVAPLNSSSKIEATYLPSYVDDVLSYSNLAAFPVTGEAGIIYINEELNLSYRWNGSAYTPITSVISSTSDVPEGTNLYFTDARARAAAVVNSTAGNETTYAPSVAAMKAYVAANAGGNLDVEHITLTGDDILALSFSLSREAQEVLYVSPKGYPLQREFDDFTLSVNDFGSGDVTVISFAGDMLELVEGDIVSVGYSY